MGGNYQNWDNENLPDEKEKDMIETVGVESINKPKKMRRFISSKAVAVVLVLIAFVVAAYFYREGIVSLLPMGEDKKKIVELTYHGKEYKLSYKEKAVGQIVDIARFEEKEDWQGDGEFEFADFFEGESSIALASRNGEIARTSLEKELDLSKASKIKLFISIKDDPADLQELNILLGDKTLDNYYKYPVRGLKSKWNLLVIPKEQFAFSSKELPNFTNQESSSSEETTFNWASVDKIAFEVQSRPNTRTTVYFDFFWAEENDSFLEDWNVANPQALTLARVDDRLNLLFLNYGAGVTTLSKIGSAKDFTFQAKFIPIKIGTFGLFLRGDYSNGFGYYFIFDGVGKNSWAISKYGLMGEKKKSVPLITGEVKNFAVEEGESYWLRAVLKEDKITTYFSTDGNNFTELAEVSDGQFNSGGVGIAVGGKGMTLADEFYFAQ